jgi:hypothetical protein
VIAENLAERFERGPLALDEARRLARDLCTALLRSGRHGGLTAVNVVSGPDGWLVGGFTGRGDERDDVRAVGALLYQALTGTPAGAGIAALPRAMRAPILRSLHAERGRRHGTVAELAEALGVVAPRPPRRRTRALWPVVAAVIGLGVVGAARLGRSTPRPALVAAVAPAPAPPPAPRRAVELGAFAAPGWLADGLPAMIAVVLDENPGLERGAGGLRVDGAATAAGAGWRVDVRVVDPATDATLATEHIVVAGPGELVARVGELAARLSAALAPGAHPPALAALTTSSVEAWQAYAAHDFRRAAALDPRFVLAHLAVARENPDAAPAELAVARPLAVGAAAARALRRLDAATPEALVAALEAERTQAPHDLALAAELAAAYRRAGRVADCAALAERAGDPAARDLAACRLAAGDGPGALAAARRADDPLFEGDVALTIGRIADARDAYHRAGARAGARPALLLLRAQGKCKTRAPMASVDDARVVWALANACGDRDRARAAEAYARRAGGDLAAPATVAAARARADAAGWSADGLDRGRRLGPLFAVARAEKQAAVLAGFAPAPSDRWGLFEEPLLLEVALTEAELGSPDDAALACAELAETGAAVGLYCQGRAAEAAGDPVGAWQGYRAFLDRWSDADPEQRWVRDARVRIMHRARK